jgi:hypothetical protein
MFCWLSFLILLSLIFLISKRGKVTSAYIIAQLQGINEEMQRQYLTNIQHVGHPTVLVFIINTF